MDVWGLIGGIVGGALSSIGVTSLVLTAAKDRWMAEVKHRYDADIEHLRASLEMEQKSAAAALEHVVYIGKAQYDLEVEAYKTLWPALSAVRIRARVILMPDIFVLAKDENEYNRRLRLDGIERFHEAHNVLVQETERFAPFYPESIKTAARLVTEADNELTTTLIESVHVSKPAEHNRVIQLAMENIGSRVAAVESQIRKRLGELRVVA